MQSEQVYYGQVAQSPMPVLTGYADPMVGTPDFGGAYPNQSPLHSVRLSDMPTQSEYVVPTVIRKKPSGYFRALETFTLNRIPIDTQALIAEILPNPTGFGSTMWSGVLTGTKLDRNYSIVLAVIEKVTMAVLDETVRRLRDECDAHQLAVFVRRIWSVVLPMAAQQLEKFIINYHAENHAAFFKELDDEWDSEDEAREKKLDELDAELAEIQAEIDEWEAVQRGLTSDPRCDAFLRSQAEFQRKLDLVASVKVDSSTPFLPGGAIPVMPPWEHPAIRMKRRIEASLKADLEDQTQQLGAYLIPDHVTGIPVSGFCFEEVAADSQWDTWTGTGWDVDVDMENVRPVGTPELVLADMGGAKTEGSNRRLSLDALKAFQ